MEARVVFYLHPSIRIALFGHAPMHIGHYATHRQVTTTFQSQFILQVFHLRVAHIIQYHGEFIQRMGRKVDAHQFTLFVQAFYLTPSHARFWHWRRSYLYPVETSEKRVLRFSFSHLIALSVAHQRIEEHLILGITSKVLLTRNAEIIEATAKHQ